MHIKFATFFVDPVTHEPLKLRINERQGDQIISGSLNSTSASYPIVRGIPRFVPYESHNYSSSFGYQWNRWPRLQFESQNVGRPMAGHTLNMFDRIVGPSAKLKGEVLVDVGCGPGRFIEVARSKGAQVIGIDFSLAVEAAATNFAGDTNVCICQADALHLPIATGLVDGAYSIGVLHHTPNPQRGVSEMSRITRADGWISVLVYGKGGYYDFPTVQMWRRIFKTLSKIAGNYPPLIYSYLTVYGLSWLTKLPVIGKAIRVVLPFVRLPDRRWSVLDTFDSITPTYQSAHESFEVYEWFKKSGLVEIEPGNWGFTAYHAKKPNDVRPAASAFS